MTADRLSLIAYALGSLLFLAGSIIGLFFKKG